MNMRAVFKGGQLWGLVFVCISVVSAGSLNPPGVPGSTMKTLDEVEPRIAINDENTPGDPNNTYIIAEPGSYYLTGNFTSNFKHGILIDADDVTIDLMGYRLWSSYSKPLGNNEDFDGIHIAPDHKNIEIRNGTIASDNTTIHILTFRGFRNGIYSEADTKGIRVKDICVTDARGNGILLLSTDSFVKNCTASGNGNSATGQYVYGIHAGDGSTATGNTVSNNGDTATGLSVYGICAGAGSTVTGNTVYNNGNSSTSQVHGIYISSGSTVTGNTVYGNGYLAASFWGIYTVGNCTVTGNTIYANGSSAEGNVLGIHASSGSTVIGNMVNNNGYSTTLDVLGIYANSGCTVTGNTTYYNGRSASGNVYGIYAKTACTVTANTSYDNGDSGGSDVYGIYLEGYSLVDQNTVYSNGDGAGSAINMDTTIATCVYGKNVAP